MFRSAFGERDRDESLGHALDHLFQPRLLMSQRGCSIVGSGSAEMVAVPDKEFTTMNAPAPSSRAGSRTSTPPSRTGVAGFAPTGEEDIEPLGPVTDFSTRRWRKRLSGFQPASGRNGERRRRRRIW